MNLTRQSEAQPELQGGGDQIALSILIVAYQSADIISACLSSIKAACSGVRYEVLMIDNGDGSTEALVSDAFQAVGITPSRGNIGFAAANNLLANVAQGQYLLLLNPDVILKPGAADALIVATTKHPTAAAWGGVTLDSSGGPDLGNTLQNPSLREMASRVVGRSRDSRNTGSTAGRDEQAEVLSGSFVMFDRAVWNEAGGMDERYFLYCEEVDLFYRLAQKGHVFWRISAARGFHDIGHGNILAPSRLLYRAAGTMQFVRLHWSKSRQLLAFILIWIGAVQRLVAGRLFGKRNAHLANLATGYRSVALRPNDWRFGYDKKRGLMVKLGKANTNSG